MNERILLSFERGILRILEATSIDWPTTPENLFKQKYLSVRPLKKSSGKKMEEIPEK